MKAILCGEMPWPWFNLCPNRCCFEMTQSKKGWMKGYLTIHLFCHNFAIYRKYKCVWVKYERQVLWCLWIDNHVIAFNFFFLNFELDIVVWNHPQHCRSMAPINKAQSSCLEATEPAPIDTQWRLKDWTSWFYTTLRDSEEYKKAHQGLFREFEKLSTLICGVGIITYVKAVFNHMVLQGYQPDVHFQALFQGMLNLPPLRWVPPPDQFEKSPTLILPPWSFTKQSNKLPTGPQPVPGPLSAAAKGKGRADQAIGPK